MRSLPLPLSTERLTLRTFRPEDAGDLYEYLGDPEVAFFEPYDALSRAACVGEAARRANDPRFIAVCLGEKLIGNVFFAISDDGAIADLGYVINRAYWGRGYASEAARAAVDAGFALGIRRVEAGCAEKNPRSWRLLEGLGMRLAEKIPHCVCFKRDADGNEIWLDARRYELENPGL